MTTPKPLDPPMVPFAVVGIGLWVVAALVILPFRDRLAGEGHGDWLRIAVAGVLWGIPGLLTMVVHDRNRRRRRARAVADAAGSDAGVSGSFNGSDSYNASDSFKTDGPSAP